MTAAHAKALRLACELEATEAQLNRERIINSELSDWIYECRMRSERLVGRAVTAQIFNYERK